MSAGGFTPKVASPLYLGMTSYAVHVHRAETPKFALAHCWWDTTLATNCGLPCAWEDGHRVKLATGWVAAPLAALRCPTCYPRSL